MLTRLGLGRTAVLRASATGLLAISAAVAVGVGAWLVADDLDATTSTVLITATTEVVPSGPAAPHSDLTHGRDRADAELRAAETAVAAATAASTPSEEYSLRSSGPLRHPNPGGFFRIHDAIAAPEATENAAPVELAVSPPPAAAELEDTPQLLPGDRVRTTISFYYCEHDPESINPAGDGGGFCGAMRDGTIVYPGAAACAHAYLGQRFRILGDPLERIYRCADTGSAVAGQHRDIWFQTSDEGWDWLWLTGATATIEVVE